MSSGALFHPLVHLLICGGGDVAGGNSEGAGQAAFSVGLPIPPLKHQPALDCGPPARNGGGLDFSSLEISSCHTTHEKLSRFLLLYVLLVGRKFLLQMKASDDSLNIFGDR